MKVLIAFCLILFSQDVISQICESYNRNLFHLLPGDFPDCINCKDNFGKKQGWWIHYSVGYNSVWRPDVHDTGEYVPDYKYGMYKDDTKIGVWRTINNVHNIFELRLDTFYYSTDTILIRSGYFDAGWKRSTLYYNTDSSIIRYRLSYDKGIKNICIECDENKNPNTDNCVLTYRNKRIKTFPLQDFNFERVKSSYWYSREKFIIDKMYERKRK